MPSDVCWKMVVCTWVLWKYFYTVTVTLELEKKYQQEVVCVSQLCCWDGILTFRGFMKQIPEREREKNSSDYSSQTRILLFYVFCFFVFFSTNSKIVLLSFCFDYQQDAKASRSAYLIIRIVVQMVFCDKEENMKSCQPFAANCPFNYDEDMQKAYNVAKSGGQRRQQNFSHEAHSVLNLSDSFVWFSSEFNWTLNWSMCCGPFHIKPLGPKQFTQQYKYAITHLQMFKWTGYKHKKPSSSQQ